jgi:uncharacterized protein YdiU (UPF0061 family)
MNLLDKFFNTEINLVSQIRPQIKDLTLNTLLETDATALQQLDEIRNGFANVMHAEMEKMFAAKLGLASFDGTLFGELAKLMMQTSVDYTIFFRELSTIPEDITPLKRSFYNEVDEALQLRWSDWLAKWQSLVISTSEEMKRINPKYSLREWLLAPAYQQAAKGDYALIRELQEVMTQPYAEQSKAVEEKFYKLKAPELSALGGVSHMSCSS